MSLMTLLERGIGGNMAVLIEVPLLLMMGIMTVVIHLESPVKKKILPVQLLWFVDYLMAHKLAYLLIRGHMARVSWQVVCFGPLVTC